MIIDCHGHYTVLPGGHDAWRERQVAAYEAGEPAPPYPDITDAEIRETIEANQLRLIRERGADLTIFSPRASAMAPHVGDEGVAIVFVSHFLDQVYELCDRVTVLRGGRFVGEYSTTELLRVELVEKMLGDSAARLAAIDALAGWHKARARLDRLIARAPEDEP